MFLHALQIYESLRSYDYNTDNDTDAGNDTTPLFTIIILITIQETTPCDYNTDNDFPRHSSLLPFVSLDLL